jgi:hypothetical protein
VAAEQTTALVSNRPAHGHPLPVRADRVRPVGRIGGMIGLADPAERVVSRTTTPAVTTNSSITIDMRERLVRNVFRVVWIPIEPTPFRLGGPCKGR